MVVGSFVYGMCVGIKSVGTASAGIESGRTKTNRDNTGADGIFCILRRPRRFAFMAQRASRTGRVFGGKALDGIGHIHRFGSGYGGRVGLDCS